MNNFGVKVFCFVTARGVPEIGFTPNIRHHQGHQPHNSYLRLEHLLGHPVCTANFELSKI